MLFLRKLDINQGELPEMKYFPSCPSSLRLLIIQRETFSIALKYSWVEVREQEKLSFLKSQGVAL